MATAATASATRFAAAGAAHGFRWRTSPLTHRAFFPKRRVAAPLRSRLHILAPAALQKPDVQIKEAGQPETLDYRAFFLDVSGKRISPWHDVPLHLGDGVFNFIVEIPKDTSAKMEVATDEPYTPIKQDTKKGKLRYYPYNINWNYGLLPQTWEDPSFANSEVEGAFGDNDPVDVVEIGETQAKMGDILKVKPLAALAMIDEGELDWKIVAISLDDPRALLVNDVNDVEKHFPGTLMAIRDWFRDYKIPDGKPANKFGLGNKAANKLENMIQVLGIFPSCGKRY
ncbi:soluble inorganic pyrophosphatase 6, chloroplastic-like isoform X2 [Phoenix dactylifera]|uniref:inorganic diphosphatase n=1 Tax=Phoenix dactylifera TaxID=42345 RepID=A0A8B8ZC12_PHODC|nr:soluble inorganic pyrophosphatase 6, chloroplastic-like isoform X2 [Phoenix dactylifera]